MFISPFFSSSEPQTRYALWLALLAALLFFPALGARDFWAPAEPRYAEIARVMFAKGEWIVPTVNGDLYTDKPILYFWLVLIASNIAGAVSEWTVRLPVALGGLGVVLTTYVIGKDFFSPRVGFIAGAVLATSARVIWEGRWAHVDMPFTFFFALSMYFTARTILNKGNPYEMLAAYALLALATLTKGLIGVVLPALILLSFVAIRRDWRLLLRARLPLGIGVFLLIAAPWFIWVNSATDGKWLEDFIYLHHIQRYTAGVGHRQPFYYYFKTLPVDFLPWTVFALPALFAYKLERKSIVNPASFLLVLWFAVVFLFFSFSDTKRDLYLLPLFPPLALLVGVYIDDLVTGKLPLSKIPRSMLLLFFAALSIGCLALPVAAWLLRKDAFWVSLPVALTMACCGLAAFYFIWRRIAWLAFISTVFSMLLGVLTASVWLLPFIDQFKSPRSFALKVKSKIPATAQLFIYADTMNDYNFYMERTVISVVRSLAELQKLLVQEQPAYMLIKQKDLDGSQLITGDRIILQEGTGERAWCLIALGHRTSQ
jgi:4-amino-4-deoxy-L-arabinose transferase-like glycosyltransferase